jgi:agmatine deiminase
MPPEWARHEATWMVWPHNTETWSGNSLRRVEDVYLKILKVLSRREKVRLLVKPSLDIGKLRRRALKKNVRTEALEFHRVVTADGWIRDYGPIFLKGPEGEKAWCKWRFNAWGGKYSGHKKDDRVFGKAQKMTGAFRFDAERVLEGGSIDVNGLGDCLTTEQCLLNPNRNRASSRKTVESALRVYLGIRRVLWLEGGILGDDTDGHVDDVARFAGPGTILAAYEEDPRDGNHEILRENWERLRFFRRRSGTAFRLIKLPMPRPLRSRGKRLPASYANFYAANGVVLLPVYGDPADRTAVGIFKKVFSGRKIIPVDCRTLVEGLGAIHCLTQQEPA